MDIDGKAFESLKAYKSQPSLMPCLALLGQHPEAGMLLPEIPNPRWRYNQTSRTWKQPYTPISAAGCWQTLTPTCTPTDLKIRCRQKDGWIVNSGLCLVCNDSKVRRVAALMNLNCPSALFRKQCRGDGEGLSPPR